METIPGAYTELVGVVKTAPKISARTSRRILGSGCAVDKIVDSFLKTLCVLWWIFRQSTSPCKSAKKGWFVLFLSTAFFFFSKLITEKQQKLASHCTQVDTLGECNNTNNATMAPVFGFFYPSGAVVLTCGLFCLEGYVGGMCERGVTPATEAR
jgi:hypothetical protein